MRIECLSQADDMETLRNPWGRLLASQQGNTIFLTYEWFATWWGSFGREFSLSLLVGRTQQGVVCGIAPCMTSGRILTFIANSEVSDYCDFICSDESRRAFLSAVLDYFNAKSEILTGLHLINIRESSPTLKLLQELAGDRGLRCEVSPLEVAPVLDLKGTYGEYLQGLDRKKRHELRRKTRRTQTLEDSRVKVVTGKRELERLLPDFFSLHEKSDPEKQRFWQKEGMRAFFAGLIGEFAPRSWIELYTLEHRDRPIGFVFCFIYARQAILFNAAFDREYSRYNPGFFLFHEVIRRSFEKKRTHVDFLRGAENYKYFFGPKDSKIYRISIMSGDAP